MSAGEASRAPAVLPLTRPGNNVGLPNLCTDIGISAADSIAFNCIGGRSGDQNPGKVLKVILEADIVIPFILDLEWLHSARDWMRGKSVEFRFIDWIHRIVEIEETADPIEHFRMPKLCRRLGGIVHEHQSSAAGGGLCYIAGVAFLEGKMTLPAIEEKVNGIRLFKIPRFRPSAA